MIDIIDQSQKFTAYPEFVAAIVKVESNNGRYLIDKDKDSYGLAQLKLKTVRWLGNKDKRLKFTQRVSNECLITLLMRSEHFNIMVSSIYVEYLVNRYGIHRGLNKYNGCHNDVYFNKVMGEN